MDWDTLGDAHMWWTGWTADYPDPDGFFRGLLTLGKWPFYRDDDILELLERGRSLRDQGERMRVYHEIDHLWVGERAAILPIAYPRSNLLRRPWIEGLWASPLSRAHLDTVVVGERAGRACGLRGRSGSGHRRGVGGLRLLSRPLDTTSCCLLR